MVEVQVFVLVPKSSVLTAIILGGCYGVIITGELQAFFIMIVIDPPIVISMPHPKVCTPVPNGHVFVLILY